MDRPTPFDMDRFFKQFARMQPTPWTDQRVRVETVEGSHHVVIDLPGFERDAISVTYADETLSVTAVDEHGDGAGHRRHSVEERISVPGDVDTDAITASYHNGVLEVTLPVAESGTGIDIDVE